MAVSGEGVEGPVRGPRMDLDCGLRRNDERLGAMIPMTHLRQPGEVGFWIPACAGMTGYAKASPCGEGESAAGGHG